MSLAQWFEFEKVIQRISGSTSYKMEKKKEKPKGGVSNMEYSESCLERGGGGIQPQSQVCGFFSAQPPAVEVLEQTSPQIEGKKEEL